MNQKLTMLLGAVVGGITRYIFHPSSHLPEVLLSVLIGTCFFEGLFGLVKGELTIPSGKYANTYAEIKFSGASARVFGCVFIAAAFVLYFVLAER
jgi:hypothetical protein